MLSVKLRLLLPLLTYIWIFISGSAHAFTLSIDSAFQSEVLGPHLEYLAEEMQTVGETTKGWNVNSVRNREDWQTSEQKVLNWGYTDTAYWVRFYLENTGEQRHTLIIESDYPFLNTLDVYINSPNGERLHHEFLGDSRPVTQRSIPHAHNLVSVSLAPRQTVEVLLRVGSDSLVKLPLKVWDSDLFIQHDYQRSMFLVLAFGVLIAISIYHAILAILTKDTTPLYLALFMFSLVVQMSMIEGFANALLWPSLTSIGDPVQNLAFTGTVVGSSLFTIRILHLSETDPALEKILRVLLLLALVLLVAAPVLPHSVIIKTYISLSALVLFIQCWACLRQWRSGYIPARYLLLAALVFFVVNMAAVLKNYGVILPGQFVNAAPYVGAVFAALIYSLANSYRINIDQMEKEEAQRKLAHELDELVRVRTDELEVINQQLKIASITDGLTNVYNRRYFDEQLQREYNRAYRDKTPVSLLILDIDHFKRLNDNYGHPFGDLCLKSVASNIKSCVHRPSDCVARYGGEEFVVLLPCTDIEGALNVALRLNQTVASHNVEDAEHSTKMTICVGVASEVPQQKDQHFILLKRADECLYRAKENGRDRVEH